MTLEDRLEIEFKLRATRPVEVAEVDAQLREVGLACRRASRDEHADCYLDDEPGSLRAAGIGLRLRRTSGEGTLTLKHRGRRAGARFERRELECPWAGQAPPANADELPAQLRLEVQALIGVRPLRPTLHLAVARERRVLHRHGQDLCEVAIDRVTAHCGARRATFDEVEIEVHDDVGQCERLAASLAARLQLQPAEHDKPDHAALLLGLAATVPGADGMPTDDRAPESVRRYAVQLQTAARETEGTARLHRMRVALRRLRTLLGVLPELWPDRVAAELRAELGRLANRIGDARDLDVLLDTVGPSIASLPEELRPAGHEALGWLRSERDRAVASFDSWWREPERRAAVARHTAAVLSFAADRPRGDERIAALARTRAEVLQGKLRKRLRKIDASTSFADVHRARLHCKRLRYVAEFVAELGHEVVTPAVLAGLIRLHKQLGRACDRHGAATRLASAASRLPSHAPPASVAALQRLAERQGRQALRKQARAAKTCAQVAALLA